MLRTNLRAAAVPAVTQMVIVNASQAIAQSTAARTRGQPAPQRRAVGIDPQGQSTPAHPGLQPRRASRHPRSPARRDRHPLGRGTTAASPAVVSESRLVRTGSREGIRRLSKRAQSRIAQNRPILAGQTSYLHGAHSVRRGGPARWRHREAAHWTSSGPKLDRRRAGEEDHQFTGFGRRMTDGSISVCWGHSRYGATESPLTPAAANAAPSSRSCS